MAHPGERYRRDWWIYYDPPPIPTRAWDWHWVHEDYDGLGDPRHGDAPTREACMKAIDEWIEEEEADLEERGRTCGVDCGWCGGCS